MASKVLVWPAPPIMPASLASVVRATAQPPCTSPTTFSAGMRTSVKNTSLKCDSPVACTSGRISTPGVRMSTMKNVMPLCFGASGSVRASRMPKSAWCALEVQTFWPLTTHSSPSSTARVDSAARSLPAPGSLKSWHHISSPRRSGPR